MSAYIDLEAELNKTLTTKNEIKNVLQSNGSDITDDTAFSEYPTKIQTLLSEGSFDMNNITYDVANAKTSQQITHYIRQKLPVLFIITYQCQAHLTLIFNVKQIKPILLLFLELVDILQVTLHLI